MATNPMHQFEVYKIGPEINLGGVNLSFTNASLFMSLSSILILLFFCTDNTTPLIISNGALSPPIASIARVIVLSAKIISLFCNTSIFRNDISKFNDSETLYGLCSIIFFNH